MPRKPENSGFWCGGHDWDVEGSAVPGAPTHAMRKSWTPQKTLVAYSQWKIALENAMPSYSGRLGVLRETRSVPRLISLQMVEVFEFCCIAKGTARGAGRGWFAARRARRWKVEDFSRRRGACTVPSRDRRVELRPGAMTPRAAADSDVQVYFLDCDLPSKRRARPQFNREPLVR